MSTYAPGIRRSLFGVEITRADGSTYITEHDCLTATDAVSADKSRLGPGVHARLASSPDALRVAARQVAQDQAQSAFDEWIAQGFVTVAEACEHARNTLRLPEEPYVPGGYPLDDDGSSLATAYRMVLEATPDELAAATGPNASIRVPRPEWMSR